MPVHDWRRVSAGTFHDFHLSWIAELRKSLNSGLLPDGYYAQAEQVVGRVVPDVLTLQMARGDEPSEADGDGVATMPRTRIVSHVEVDPYVLRQRSVAIRSRKKDRLIALIEIVSPGK